MSTEFNRIHLLHAALQVKGASVEQIEVIKSMVASLGGSRFAEWNKPLDAEGMKLLTCILGDRGLPYAEMAIAEFVKMLTTRLGISQEDLQKIMKILSAHISGLN